MYTQLLESLAQKPIPFAQSTSKFWDDEHISKYMLAAHLDPDLEAASRQHWFIDASVKWIASLVHNPSMCSLLDLGCGPGLYAQAFSAFGFRVTGVDYSKRSIDYARSQVSETGRAIDYHYQNYLTIEYANAFDVVTLIYCDFGVLHPQDRALLLRKIRTALKPGGLLILDGFTQNQYNEISETKTVEYQDSGFWSAQPYLCIKSSYRYEECKAYLEQYLVVTKTQLNCYNIWNQAFDVASFASQLTEAGFSGCAFYGDVCGAPLTDKSKTFCVVATA